MPTRDANAAVLWFRAELDDGLWLGNPPHLETHWGQLVARGTSPKRPLGIHVEVDEDELIVQYTP